MSALEMVGVGKKYDAWMKSLVCETHQSADLLGAAAQSVGIPQWARVKLRHAHEYLYAAMLVEFVKKAETEIICTGVRMPDGSIATARQFLVESVIGSLLSAICKAHDDAEGFTLAIRSKIAAMLKEPV